jgi:multiple sugar transport system ATP-binding protein
MVETELRGLGKTYGDVVAVDDVDLTIHDGEFLVILGPSGCGKSTTLRMIAGLEEATSGEILVDGEVVNDLGPSERDFAMVFQQVALYPHMDVRENISSPLRAAKEDPDTIEERVERIAGMLDIGDLLDRAPSELSGGQQQRVAIGRALVREPRGFLLDEPFSKLDQKLRIQLQKELKRLQDRTDVTTVFVTHDQEEAMVLADRIAIMDEGRLQQVDEPDRLYRNPVNEFVADFIGNPTMNFFRVDREDDTLLIEGAPYDAPVTEAVLGRAERMAARPEDVTPVPAAEAGGGRPVADVDLVEMRGSSTHVICTLDGKELTVLQPEGRSFESGDRIALVFDFGRVNFFDATGDLIAGEPAVADGTKLAGESGAESA